MHEYVCDRLVHIIKGSLCIQTPFWWSTWVYLHLSSSDHVLERKVTIPNA